MRNDPNVSWSRFQLLSFLIIIRNLLDFASKDMVRDPSDNSPSQIHPLVGASGTAIRRSDKIEVRESSSAGVFLAGMVFVIYYYTTFCKCIMIAFSRS